MTTSSPRAARRQATFNSASDGFKDSKAHVGHTVAQVPQPTHFEASITNSPSSKEMHPEVHAAAHFRQSTLRLRTFAHRSRCTRMAPLSTTVNAAPT